MDYGTVALADGRAVRLVQQAYNDNHNGEPAWFASGYLSTETPADETGPTVKVRWASLGAESDEDDADWENPEAITHDRLGKLTPA